VRLWRNGREREVTVTLGEAPISDEPARVAEAPARADERLGIQVSDLTSDLADRWGYEESGGVVIVDVTAGGPAARRGVGPGLKILEVNRQSVSSASDVTDALEGVDSGEIVTLLAADPAGSTYVLHIRAAR
jgi:serine protease Do